MNPDDQQKRPWLSPTLLMLAALVASFLLQLAIQWKFVVSNFMILDDVIYVPSYLHGDYSSVPTNFLPYKLLEVTSAFKSVVLIKLFSLLTLGMITAAYTLILNSMTKDRALAALTALAFTTYTIALEQGFFVTGSHPSLGMVFALGSLVVFIRSVSSRGSASTRLIFASTLLALLASVSSPTTLLMLFAPPLWVIIVFLFQRNLRNLILGLVLTIWPVILRAIAGNNSFHYAKAEGWTELTLDNFVQNIGNALTATFVAPLSGALLVAGLYIGLFALLAAFLIFGLMRLKRAGSIKLMENVTPNNLLILMACALLAAILVLGPSLVVTAYHPRYAWPAYLFGGILLAAPLVWLSRHSGKSRRLVVAMLVCFIALNTISSMQRRDTEFLPYLKAHRIIAPLTHDAAPAWPANAQVVMLLPRGLSSPSQGNNHWSTGYLRLLSNQPDILALIGPDFRLSQDPFVEEWSRNGSDYWSNKDGRLSRDRMKGLEPDRPTYAYRYNAVTGAMEPVRLAFQDPSGARFILAPGQSLDTTQAFTPAACAAAGSIFNWPVTQHLEGMGTPWRAEGLPWAVTEHLTFNSAGAPELDTPVNIKSAIAVRLTLVLSPDHMISEDEPTSATFPPMPLRSPAINIYHKASGFHVTSTGIPSIVSGNPSDKIRLVGVEGCFYQAEIGGEIYPLEIRSLNGDWTLGRGFKERFWQGRIDWTLETAPQ
ncbi:hypothetical protein [Hyphomonas sp.]|uniref:hypothetical protein n=1 Tax=Hyphomonas sp. TaxID=87 RepID=UPI0030FAD92A